MAAILYDQSHFSPFQINTQFFILFIKWLPATILDDQKSLSIAFLVISDQYATFFPQNGCRRPSWMTENHFRSHFSPFQINTQLLLFSQNGCRRPFWMTGNHFLSHFSPFQINTQFLILFIKWLPATILDDQKSLSIAFQINTQLFFHKMAADGHLE